MTVFVGIEGPVLAGKTSVAAEVAQRLSAEGVPCAVAPCFIDAALSRGYAPPATAPGDDEVQHAAIEFFFALDRERRHAITGQPVVTLLDRTAWTVVTHTAVLADLGVNDAIATFEARHAGDFAALRPDALAYLDVSHAMQLERSRARAELPWPLLDERFNAAFRAFFEHHVESHCVDADQPLAEVIDAVYHFARECA
jgi:thymidylate kinase